ncbi:MAG: primosomal protein N' [Candidatus Kerfeldbacteria bacterium]|nr:primosomal protein N' [Candidatus Kerfeldbacteria bacterium]
MPRSRLVEVALLRRLPRGVHFFDYLVPGILADELAVGDLVQVPFRGRMVNGAVVRLKQRTRVPVSQLKVLSAQLAKKFITTRQLSLARQVADHYGVAFGSALGLAVPFLPNRRFAPAAYAEIAGLSQGARQRSSLAVLVEQADKRLSLVKALATHVTARRQQLLLLVPEISDMAYWCEHLAKVFTITTYSAEAKLTDKRRAWENIRDGRVQLIIGTRAALFLPFCSLGGIVVDGAACDNYKQSDQNPRYDALEVAKWLAKLWSGSLALISAAPLVVTWHDYQQGNLSWQKLGPRPPASVAVINLSGAQNTGSKQILAPELQELLQKTIDSGQRAFLYLNRRGTATSVICRDCGYVVNCPKCARPMAWEARHNKLTCYNCGTMSRLPLPCPACRGLNIKYLGTGLSKLEDEIAHTWPRLNLLVLEGAVSPARASLAKSAQLVIGSRAAWRYLDFSTFGLLAMVLPDAELAVPEWQQAEQVWQTARHFVTCGARQVVVQTYRPDHYIWRSLMARSPKIFYAAELEQRKMFNYPPFASLVRFTVQSPLEDEALRQARSVYNIIAPKLKAQAKLVGPYPDYYKQVRGRYRFHLLLRYGRGFNPEALWRVLPDDVIIDRHPRTVLS